MYRGGKRTVRVLLGISTASVAAVGSIAVLAGGTASAATLDCSARSQDQTTVIGASACRAVADDTSNAISRVYGDGVAAADSRDGGFAAGISLFGGVSAAESRAGALASIAVGPDSLALGRTDSAPLALVISGPGGRAAVGDASVGAICAGGPSLVFNVATGQGCVSDGARVWSLP
ncbi:DUF6764 family protein [Rhodococcus sp. 27YEA15]|uniref:DUF6764 family protein n=1 Tax=Rhodococcus sp. 27YEA15 TaxID=3156259 RepID=UPI003C7D8302